VVAAAATFPLRLMLHYSSPTPPSRPMAALIMRDPSREGHESTPAGYEMPLPPAVPGGVAPSVSQAFGP
jgi:hypothetical protein